jgi:organic hydroperoxide reductase OsmC/OhrA
MLNAYFGLVAEAIAPHGGEILRFIGDAMLIVFPADAQRGLAPARRAAGYIVADGDLTMEEAPSFTLHLEQIEDYEFRVRFDWPGVPELKLDEPEPLGRRAGPNAARLIGAAVADCLASSLIFCMRKFRQAPGKLGASVTGTLARNERGRLRLGGFEVEIRLADAAGDIKHFDRCLAQFEDFCVVTESVRKGIPVGVRVLDANGVEVFSAGEAAAS